jgi:hypothetical protein
VYFCMCMYVQYVCISMGDLCTMQCVCQNMYFVCTIQYVILQVFVCTIQYAYFYRWFAYNTVCISVCVCMYNTHVYV